MYTYERLASHTLTNYQKKLCCHYTLIIRGQKNGDNFDEWTTWLLNYYSQHVEQLLSQLQ